MGISTICNFTVNDFIGLLGKTNDGQFVINNDAKSDTQTLLRVNRGWIFTRHKYTQQNVSSKNADAAVVNARTREALFNAFCQYYTTVELANDVTTAQIKKLRHALHLEDTPESKAKRGLPLNCREVKELLEDNGLKNDVAHLDKAPTDKTVTKTRVIQEKSTEDNIPGYASLTQWTNKKVVLPRPSELFTPKQIEAYYNDEIIGTTEAFMTLAIKVLANMNISGGTKEPIDIIQDLRNELKTELVSLKKEMEGYLLVCDSMKKAGKDGQESLKSPTNNFIDLAEIQLSRIKQKIAQKLKSVARPDSQSLNIVA